MAVIIQSLVLWIETPFRSVGGYRHFEGTCCIHFWGYSEMSVSAYKTACHHNLEEQNLTSLNLSSFMSLLKLVLEMMTFLS